MFGQNVIRPKVDNSESLAVQSVFYTIQGEGPYSGVPALFIRLAGCNLACTFCDTEFESQADSPRPWREVWQEIVDRFPRTNRKFVVLTGGEPLRQNPIKLVEALLSSGTETIQIETAGTLWQSDLEPAILAQRVVLVCSPKTPGVNSLIAKYCHHWKYVVKADELFAFDGLPNAGTQPATQGKPQRIYRCTDSMFNQVWVSPCDEQDAAKNKANQDAAVKSCMTHGYRLSLQVHKIIGVE